jgi:hypothetical protein
MEPGSTTRLLARFEKLLVYFSLLSPKKIDDALLVVPPTRRERFSALNPGEDTGLVYSRVI